MSRRKSRSKSGKATTGDESSKDGLSEEDARLWAQVTGQGRQGQGKTEPKTIRSRDRWNEDPGSGSVAGSGGLSQEDAYLWSEVTKSLTPLKRPARKAVLSGAEKDKSTPLPDKWQKAAGKAPEDAARKSSPVAKRADGQGTPRQGKGAPVDRRIPDLTGFSRREMRQLSSGRQPIEARLDLHGLRQAEAHVALRGFIFQCQAQGLRHVLVITGKGRTFNREESLFGQQEPGVLRRLTPMWLSEPDLRPLVAGYTEAPANHGGEGALYVRLRKKN